MTDRHSPASSRLAIAVLLVGAGGPAAAGQCVYDVEVIEGPSCGVFSIPMIAEGINAAGRICGHVMACDLETQFAMHQRPGGSLEVLEFGDEDFRRPYAMAIADSGTIVGELEFDEPIDGVIRTAFVHDGDEFHLFDVPEGGNFARAEAVTADGSRVAGLWGNFVTGDPARPRVLPDRRRVHRRRRHARRSVLQPRLRHRSRQRANRRRHTPPDGLVALVGVPRRPRDG